MVLIGYIGKARVESFIVADNHAGNDVLLTTITLPQPGRLLAACISGYDNNADCQTTFEVSTVGGIGTYGQYVTTISAISRRLIAGAITVYKLVTVILE